MKTAGPSLKYRSNPGPMVSPWLSMKTLLTKGEVKLDLMLASRSVRAVLGPARSTSCTASDWAHDGFPAMVSYQGWSATIACPGNDATSAMNRRPAASLAGEGISWSGRWLNWITWTARTSAKTAPTTP